MEIKFSSCPLENVEADALVVIGFEGTDAGSLVAPLTDPRVSEMYAGGEFAGKALELLVLHGPPGLKAKRLVLAGGGKREKFGGAEARNLAGAALRFLKSKGMRTVAFDLGPAAAPEMVSAAVEGAVLGDFEPDRYKTDPKKHDKRVDEFTVVGGTQEAAERGRIIGEAQNFARGLVNEPGNLLTPLKLAEAAGIMAVDCGLECEILDEAAMRTLGMGSLLGVSMGSDAPPALIVLRYKPVGGSHGPVADHLGLVGKGVTFDTGGISIKPSESMEKMKYDMAGGAAVIGAMRAISQLKPGIPVTALIPAVENMPSSRAQRPGDIVTSMSGKTVEVLNTDAEGRMILIDAITYAKQLGCTHLVDAATLTGSIVVALGTLRAGAFANDDGFCGKVMSAAKAEGERLWRMPMDEEYLELIKSPFADLQNISNGRAGGSITAAMFLREFVGETPWVHLDIAGMAWLDEAKPYVAKGPTGFGMRTFVQLAVSW